MNEADTLIDLSSQAGWKMKSKFEFVVSIKSMKVKFSQEGRRAKLIADYVLEYKGAKLAVIAKSDELQVGEGVAQAKLYAQKLRLQTLQLMANRSMPSSRQYRGSGQ